MNAIMCAIQNEHREPPRSYREGFYFGDVALLSGIKVMSMESRHWERLRYFSSQTPTVALRPALYVGRLINKVFPRVFKASRAADQVVNTVAWQSICFAMFPSRLFSLSLFHLFTHSLIHSLPSYRTLFPNLPLCSVNFTIEHLFDISPGRDSMQSDRRTPNLDGAEETGFFRVERIRRVTLYRNYYTRVRWLLK